MREGRTELYLILSCQKMQW